MDYVSVTFQRRYLTPCVLCVFRPLVRRDYVELASHSDSVVRLVMAMGQSADMEHYGGLARLYHLNETLRVQLPLAS